MVKKNYMKTATILFYVSPSIETRIKNAKTIDLMEGGKEQAQNGSSGDVPNGVKDSVDIDGDGKEGNAVQTESEMNPFYNGVKDRVDIYVDGEEGKADGSSDENDKKDDEEEEEGESGKVDSSSGEESSGSSDSSSTTDSSDSSTDSDSSDSS
jgi:hypothetical protein